MIHGYDDQGSRFGPTGNFENWWTDADAKGFAGLTGKLVNQFNEYKVGDQNVNGSLTLGENIADVAGLATALDAYVLSQQGKPAQTLEGFTPEQRFFLGFAQAWRSKAREQALRNALLCMHRASSAR
jgi:putative endopeptidase